MKILVFGRSGQVAQSLLGLSSPDLQIDARGRDDVDLNNSSAIQAAISETDADAVINAAAYTAVDNAEQEPIAADKLNRLAVATIGEAAKARSIPVVQISTDYVFDGSGDRPWQPDDKTGPLGVYGASKLMGERTLSARCDNYAVLRTSWVFSAHGNNFVKTMLRLGKERDALDIVGDQYGGPTSATDIAQACANIARKLVANSSYKGVWHFSGQNDCSWADFAKEIFQQANISCAINGIPSSDYPTPATRPLNSRLDCTTTKRDFGIERPDWKKSLSRVLKELEN